MVSTPQIRKNILDLTYSTQLQYFTTTIILFFTYLVGLLIAFLTNQVDLHNPVQLWLMFFMTIAVSATAVLLFQHFRTKLHAILREIRSL